MIDKKLRGALATLLALLWLAPALAKNYDIVIDNSAVATAPVQQSLPNFPGGSIRSGQEGWVRLHFGLDVDGQVLDPIVVDSSGGEGFEASALTAAASWRFEPPSAPHFNNTVDVRFEYDQGRDLATSNFLRRHRRFVLLLHGDQLESARTEVDSAVKVGGWNLYESSMLWLMVGRIEGAEGNETKKLEAYRRALAMSNSNILEADDRPELLSNLFKLEVSHAQYAAAQRTFQRLASEPLGTELTAAGRDAAAEVDRLINGSAPISARARLHKTCDCDSGQPLWSYVPARRTFSFSNLDGNVERFDVRCDNERLDDRIVTDKKWSLPAGAGSCRVFVFGDDDARFEFVEHSDDPSDDTPDGTAVAWGDVLDR